MAAGQGSFEGFLGRKGGMIASDENLHSSSGSTLA
jgi:hypothetical protein